MEIKDYLAEIQSILMYLKENQLPAIIVVNIVNNNQSIGNITESTVLGCNLFGDDINIQ